jgi:hypothetical protein
VLLKVKDPQATLDYTLNYHDPSDDYLGTDTLASSSWSVLPATLTIAVPAATFTSTTATVWASGGTNGTKYTVTNHITTAGGRTDDRSFELLVQDV